MAMLVREAKQIAVSLSNPAKMPCKGYGIQALENCPVGKKLALIPGSTCANCYACKGQYQFANVIECHKKRKAAIDHPQWVEAMVKLIGNDPYFRWLDSGDVFSMSFLKKIIQVVTLTPNCEHWLPTREKGLISRYMNAGGFIPDNLTIRLSAAMVDNIAVALPGLNTSTVHEHGPAIGHECIAPKQNGECRDCRACWNKDIKNVSYKQH